MQTVSRHVIWDLSQIRVIFSAARSTYGTYPPTGESCSDNSAALMSRAQRGFSSGDVMW
jgi:hypothetical protein